MAEEQLAAAVDSLRVTTDPNDTSCPHPAMGSNRIMDYKAKPRNAQDQERRRQDRLLRQKENRDDKIYHARRIAQICGDVDFSVDDGENADKEEKMDTTEIKSTRKKEKAKKFNPFKNQLMLSEWLVEVPSDLSCEWITAVCPIGKRCLVVANRCTTSAYTKSGYCVNRFPSLLPGGCTRKFKGGEYTILDCVFSETERTFHVLDVMCWKGHPVTDSETEFRFFWLKTKLSEESEVGRRSKVNPFIFKAIPYFGSSEKEIYEAVTMDHGFQVDGLLFYHKRVHYYPERTPLVGWLKPYMVQEILGIELPPKLLENTPRVNKLTLIEANVRSPYGTKQPNSKQDGTRGKDEDMEENRVD